MNVFNGEFQPLGGYHDRSFYADALRGLEEKEEVRERTIFGDDLEPTVKKSKMVCGGTRALYDILAEKYPNGATPEDAMELQLEYPDEFGMILPNSIQQGIKRAIDRKKRKDAGF